MINKIKIGIVILNYNTEDELIDCINSIFKFEVNASKYNIYIIDNCSTDKISHKTICDFKKYDNITIIFLQMNYGFSGGNNFGIKKAINDGCNIIFLSNSDVVLLNNAISLMTDFLANNDDVAVVGPQILDAYGNNCQKLKKPLNFFRYLYSKKPLCYLRRLNESLYVANILKENVKFEGMCAGCFFAIKSNIIKNGLDANVFLYYEEDILASLLKNMKLNTAYIHNAKVLHYGERASVKSKLHKWNVCRRKVYAHTSQLYFLGKYLNVPLFVCNIISRLHILTWKILSIFNSNYKKYFTDYVYENNRVIKILNEK